MAYYCWNVMLTHLRFSNLTALCYRILKAHNSMCFYEIMEVEKPKTILDLHMYELDLIYGGLRWLQDKVNLGRAHPYLSEAFAYHLRDKISEIRPYSKKREEWSFILTWCGESVKCLKDKSTYNSNGEVSAEMMELAGKYCPNLNYIDLFITTENLKIIEVNLGKLQKVNELKLKQSKECYRYSKINLETVWNFLQPLPNLKKLTLCNWEWPTENLMPLICLPQLEHLDLTFTYGNDIRVFSNIWKILKSLALQSTPQTINQLGQRCVLLENLELVGYHDYKKKGLGYFPKLKRLQIVSLDEPNGHGLHFKTLHGKYNNQLEELIFPCGYITTANSAMRLSKLQALKTLTCLKIEPRCIRYIARMPLEKITLHELKKKELLILLCECKTLRWLHLDDSLDLDRKFVFELLDILETNNVVPERPFVLNLHVSHTNVKVAVKTELAAHPKGKLLDLQLVYFYLKKRY